MVLTKYNPETGLANWLDSFLTEPWYGAVAEFSPGMDIEEREHDYVVRLDVPGLEKKDIDIAVAEGVLTISGERNHETAKREKDRYYYFERSMGKFSRSLRLPAGAEAGAVEANLKNGILEVTVKKGAEARPHKIEVK